MVPLGEHVCSHVGVYPLASWWEFGLVPLLCTFARSCCVSHYGAHQYLCGVGVYIGRGANCFL